MARSFPNAKSGRRSLVVGTAAAVVVLVAGLILSPGIPRLFIIPSEVDPLPVLISNLHESTKENLAHTPRSSSEIKITDTQEPGGNKTVIYQVKNGDSFSSIWTKHGASMADAMAAVGALKKVGLKTPILSVGEKVRLAVGIGGELLAVERALGDGRVVTLKNNADGDYEAQVLEAKVSETERAVSGFVVTSLSDAARTKSIPYDVIDDFVDLFGSRVEFSRDLQPGDSFTINYMEKRDLRSGDLLKAGPVLSASLKTGGQMMAAIRFAGARGETHYFDEKGAALGDFFLRYPLQFTRISSTFSWARFHPVLQRSRPHLGVDFAAPLGTPVRAVADGVISEAGFKSEPGNFIKIQHSGRYATAYLHLSRIAPGIRKGASISRGQVIGAVGSTGISTGPHLHYALFDRGTYMDPMKASLPNLSDGFAPIPKPLLLAAIEKMNREHKGVAVAFLRSNHKKG